MSGVYQFAARLVTDSGAATPFGIISGVIPVVDTSISGPRHAVEGDPPQTQTSKSIKLKLTNIDTAFKFVELGVLTYIGLSNAQQITKTYQIPINNQSTIYTSYRGAADDFGALTTEEFIVSGASYTSAKYLAQKDGTLILGSPVEAVQPDINWFRVAQGITARYTIKQIPFSENLKFEGQGYTAKQLNDEVDFGMIETSSDSIVASPNEGYKDPLTCALYKGYRRGEVYGFTFTPVFKSGVYGPTVHIPGPASGAPTAEANPNDGGVLGSYISGELYPDDRYSGLKNTGIRLFKMPDAIQQPIILGNVNDSTCKIRIIGLQFSNFKLDTSELQYEAQIAGFIIGRLDKRGQETQLAQGIVRPNVDIYSQNPAVGATRTTAIGDGRMSWRREGHGNTITTAMTVPANINDFTFVAPDLIHNLYSANSASYIKQHSVYKSNPFSADFTYRWDSNEGGRDGVYGERDGRFRFNCGFHNILGDWVSKNYLINTTEVALEGNPYTQAPFGVPNVDYSKGGKDEKVLQKGGRELRMCSSNGFVWFSTEGGVPIHAYRDYDFYYHKIDEEYTRHSYNDYIYYNNTGTPDRTFVLHTLTRRNDKQYGPLDQMVSMFVDYVPMKDLLDGGNVVNFFNGDTFICKYGLKLSDEAAYQYAREDNSYHPCNANILLYMWIESDNNYDYRHFVQSSSYSENNIESESGTVPYYPAYKTLASLKTPFGLLTMSAENWTLPGYCKTYNTQYSTQPTIKPYVITPAEDILRKGSLVNRLLYSVQAVQGEKTDAYQIFLPNNYYDIPQEFGELTDVYVNRELFASTAQVQWKLFYNTLATQATSAGEVVLGTGGAFNRPAVPMATVNGGYAGTSHWLHAINTVWGRVIVDKRQGKFFLMQDNLAVISGDLDDKVRIDVQALNDSYGTILVGAEPLRERVFIKAGSTMWSYNLERQMFISRHSWVPRWFFSHGPYLYSNQINATIGTTGVFKHSTGVTGKFYGKVHKSSITVVANADETTSKLFQNYELITKRTTESGLNLPFLTWNQMEMFNEERYTGLLTITPKTNAFQTAAPLEVLANKVKDCFRIIASRDIVINPEVNIFTLNNHAQHKGDLELTKWLPKMRGTYMEIKLTSDNTQGPLFFYDLSVGVSENIR